MYCDRADALVALVLEVLVAVLVAVLWPVLWPVNPTDGAADGAPAVEDTNDELDRRTTLAAVVLAAVSL